jgi:hypothetical protein
VHKKRPVYEVACSPMPAASGAAHYTKKWSGSGEVEEYLLKKSSMALALQRVSGGPGPLGLDPAAGESNAGSPGARGLRMQAPRARASGRDQAKGSAFLGRVGQTGSKRSSLVAVGKLRCVCDPVGSWISSIRAMKKRLNPNVCDTSTCTYVLS